MKIEMHALACLATIAFLVAAAWAPPAMAASITDLRTLGGSGSWAHGINASGQVVGWSLTSSDVGRAFLYSGGVMKDLGVLPGGSHSVANGINASGQVVGVANPAPGSLSGCVYECAFLYTPGGGMTNLGAALPVGTESEAYGINASGQVVGMAGSDAFLYSGGVMKDLGTLPAGSYSYATGINDSGQIVGTADNNNPANAFLYSGGVMTPLGFLPAVFNSYSYATGINASGQVIGDDLMINSQDPYPWPPPPVHAFLYSAGQMTDLGTLPGFYGSIAYGINTSGQIVGEAWDLDDRPEGFGAAFLYSGGIMIDLNSLLPDDSGWVLYRATAINDSGQIVGFGRNSECQVHAFLLDTRVPEPGSLALLGAGLTLLGLTCRHRRLQ